MYDVGAALLPVLSRSHGVTARLLASVNGSSFTYPVVMQDGAVQVSASSPIRRKLTATVAASPGDPEVDVFRTEIRAEYGITTINGVTSWVPVFTGPVVEAQETGSGVMTVTCEDRWRRIINARFVTSHTTSGSTVDALADLVEAADGRITCTDLTGSTATHGASLWERDRDKAVMELAKSIGAQVVMTVEGEAEIRPVPSLADAVVWRVYGGDGGVLVEARRGASQGNTYNAAKVEGEASDGSAPVWAAAYVTDSASPLVWGGPFARRPRFYRSPLITTQAQADAAAAALLARVTGVAKTVTVDAAPHPGLDGGDVIDVEVAPGVFERHIVDGFSLPLGPGGVTIDTRTSVEAEGE